MLLSGSLGFRFNSWDIQFSQASIKKWVISPLWWRWDGVLLGVLLGSPVKFAVRHYYIVCMLAFIRGWTMSSSANVKTWIVFHWNTHITCYTARGYLGFRTPSSLIVHGSHKNCFSEQQVSIERFDQYAWKMRKYLNMQRNVSLLVFPSSIVKQYPFNGGGVYSV